MSPLTEEQKALAADELWIAYARRVMSRYVRRFPWHAVEFESAAMYGLVRAVGTFNPGAGYLLRSHIRWYVRKAAVEVFRRDTPKGHRLDHRENKVPPPTEQLAGPVESDDDPVGWEMEYHDELEWLARSVVGGAYGVAFQLYYGHAATADLKGLGAAIGYSIPQASQRHKRAEAIIRKRLATRKVERSVGRIAERFEGERYEDVVLAGKARS